MIQSLTAANAWFKTLGDRARERADLALHCTSTWVHSIRLPDFDFLSLLFSWITGAGSGGDFADLSRVIQLDSLQIQLIALFLAQRSRLSDLGFHLRKRLAF